MRCMKFNFNLNYLKYINKKNIVIFFNSIAFNFHFVFLLVL